MADAQACTSARRGCRVFLPLFPGEEQDMAQSKKKRKTSTPAGDAKGQAADAEGAVDAAGEDAPAEGAEAGAEQEATEHRLLRLQADFDNFRKRVQRERDEWYQRANDDLVTELLPVLDHFELGLNTAEQHGADPAVTQGFRLVYDQLMRSLEKIGVEPVDAEGCEFDPHHHEAVTHLPSEEHPADTVMAQTRRGYRLGGRLLRPAQVVVSSGPVESEPNAEVSEERDGAEATTE
jgi:molecular chaperone GrpE